MPFEKTTTLTLANMVFSQDMYVVKCGVNIMMQVIKCNVDFIMRPKKNSCVSGNPTDPIFQRCIESPVFFFSLFIDFFKCSHVKCTKIM